MATTTVTPDATTNSLPVTVSNETYRVYVKPDAEGKIDPKATRVVTAGKDNSTWNELDNPTEKENEGYTLLIEQTFKTYKVGSVDAARQIIDNDDELVNIINAAISAKTTRKINTALREVTDDGKSLVFEPSDLAYDTIDFLQEETRRKNLSPVEKATKMFRQSLKLMFPTLSEDEVAAKVSQMLGAVQS